LFAIYSAIKQFRHFLGGCEFTVFTDHKPLTSVLFSKTEKTPPQARYLDYIAQFTSNLQYIRGRTNIVADTVSRVNDDISSIDKIPFDIQKSQEARNCDLELERLIGNQHNIEKRKYKLERVDFCNVKLGVRHQLQKIAFIFLNPTDLSYLIICTTFRTQ